jgi:Cytochrome C'
LRLGVPQFRSAAFGRSAAASAAIILLACSTAIINSQDDNKVTTPEALDKVMKKAGPALQATNKALGSGATADARTELGTLRQAILDSQQFWIEKKREDAVKMNKETLAKIDALDTLLTDSGTDPAAATKALKEVGGACRSCHTKYRAQDAENNYILKPGSLEGL